MRTVTDFKKIMSLGTWWITTHQFLSPTGAITQLVPRECVLNNTVGFGFKDPRTGETSHCNWPKKKEITFTDNNIVIEFKNFCRLTYTQVKEV